MCIVHDPLKGSPFNGVTARVQLAGAKPPIGRPPKPEGVLLAEVLTGTAPLVKAAKLSATPQEDSHGLSNVST